MLVTGALVVARAEPENSILEIVSAFSRRPRAIKLVILGDYRPAESRFHQQVTERDIAVFGGAL